MVLSYDATTPIVPQTAVTNSDLVAIFFPYKENKELDLTPGRERRFNDPGDLTIGASDQEQTVLEIGGKFTYEVNGKISQGEITFPYNPDPNAGPAKIYHDKMSVAMSPQGCLYLCKKLNDAGTELKVWGLIGCNFVSGNDVSWPKSNAQSATARFKGTGEDPILGFDEVAEAMPDTDGIITVTGT